MKRSLLFLFLFLLLAATSVFAQSNTLTLFATSQRNGGESTFPGDPGEVLTIDFDNGSGFGASYARSFGRRLSFEGALFRTTSDVNVTEPTFGSFRLGDVDLTPITAMLRAHLRNDGPFDAYVGAGAAYVTAGDLTNAETGRIPIDNELTFAIGAGVTWDFSQRAGVAFDARYLPLTLNGDVDGETVEADMNPLLLSLGLRLRF